MEQKTGLIVGVVSCVVLAAGGIGFGVYGMIEANKKSSENSDYSQTVTINDSDDAYATRDLKDKTLRLLGSRNGLSVRDYYDDNTGDFMVDSSYMPTIQLAANNLDESMKTYITLETTMLDKEKYCNYQWTDGVKTDIDAALSQRSSNLLIGDTDIDCISYDKASGDHYDLWGENMPKMNGVSDTLTNGDFAYGASLDAYYYHIVGGRGGTCANYVVGRIKQIDKWVDEWQDYASVDINAGAFDVCWGNSSKLYSDIEKERLYETIDQDDTNWDEPASALTDDDYNSLQYYSFIFKKNSDGIYSFSSVVKIGRAVN